MNQKAKKHQHQQKKKYQQQVFVQNEVLREEN
jgi:hypothetical protein